MYTSPRISYFFKGPRLIEVNFSEGGFESGIRFFRPKLFDVNLKETWAFGQNNQIVCIDQLDPTLYYFSPKGKLLSQKKINLPDFELYKQPYKGGDVDEWFRTYCRITGCAKITGGIAISYELKDGTTTRIAKLNSDAIVVAIEPIQGWGRRGEKFAGAHKGDPIIFDPARFGVKLLRWQE